MAESIKTLTNNIEESIKSALSSSELTLRANNEQATANQEINANIEELTSIINEITQLRRNCKKERGQGAVQFIVPVLVKIIL